MKEWGTDDKPDGPWVRVGLGAFAALFWVALLWVGLLDADVIANWELWAFE